MKERKKSLVPRILAIILCVLLLFTAALSIVIAAHHVEKGELPYFFGFGVCSSNGAYENIPKNAMIFAKKVESKALQTGDIVVFYYADAPTSAKLYLASVLEVQEDGSLTLYLGENYERQTIAAENLRGRVTSSYLPHAGYVVSILEGRYGLLLSAATTVLLLAVLVLLIGGLIGDCGERRVRAAIAEARQKNADLGREMAGGEEPEAPVAQAAAEEPRKREGRQAPVREEAEAQVSEEAPAAEQAAQAEEPTEAARQEVPASAADAPVQPEAAAYAAEPRMQAASPDVMDAPQYEKPQAEAEAAKIQREIFANPEAAVMPEAPAQQAADAPEAMEDPAVADAAEAVQAAREEALPKDLRNSYVRGSFGSDRISMEVACTEKEAEVMKKLLDLTAKKRNRFGLFTSVSHLEGCTLKVWCEWEDVPIVVSILTEVRKRTAQKGESHGI